MQKEHLWVGRSKGATPAGGRRAIKGVAHSNIRVACWVGRSKAVTPAGGWWAFWRGTNISRASYIFSLAYKQMLWKAKI